MNILKFRINEKLQLITNGIFILNYIYSNSILQNFIFSCFNAFKLKKRTYKFKISFCHPFLLLTIIRIHLYLCYLIKKSEHNSNKIYYILIKKKKKTSMAYNER